MVWREKRDPSAVWFSFDLQLSFISLFSFKRMYVPVFLKGVEFLKCNNESLFSQHVKFARIMVILWSYHAAQHGHQSA